MSSSLIWRIGGAIVLALFVVWILGLTTIEVHFNASSKPTTASAPAQNNTPAPTYAPAPAYTPPPIAPSAPPTPTPAIQDVLNALTTMDQRQQIRDGNQDQRIDALGRRIESLSVPSPVPVAPTCPDGCVIRLRPKPY